MPFSSFLDLAANKEDDSKEKKEEGEDRNVSIYRDIFDTRSQSHLIQLLLYWSSSILN